MTRRPVPAPALLALVLLLFAAGALVDGAQGRSRAEGDDLMMPKENPFGKDSEMDRLARQFETFPRVPSREPLALNDDEKAAIETGGLYLWSPDNNDVGNMNEMGWDASGTEPEILNAKVFEQENPVTSFLEEDSSEARKDEKDERKGTSFVRATKRLRIPGPVQLPAPVRFPGDDDQAMLCHTPNELRKYLNFVGVDHDRETGVHLKSTPYFLKSKWDVTSAQNVDKSAWRVVDGTHDANDYDTKPKMDGLQYYWVHGRLNNFGHGHRCFDPELKYEASMDEVGPQSMEVRWGCTPFRVAGLQLQAAVGCAQKATGKEEWERIEEKLLHDLSVEAMRQPTTRYKEALHYAILKNLNITKALRDEVYSDVRHTFGSQDDPASLAVHDTGISKEHGKMKNQTKERLAVLANCFLNVQRPLMCTPALSGATGMLGHGLTDFSSEWIGNADRTVKTCHVPKGCSRLAAEQLLNFNLKQYAAIMPDLVVRRHPLWKDQCRFGSERNGPWYEHVSQGNCRLFSACFEKSLRHLCSVVPECCPDTSVHMDCIRSVAGPRCGRICQDFQENDAFKH